MVQGIYKGDGFADDCSNGNDFDNNDDLNDDNDDYDDDNGENASFFQDCPSGSLSKAKATRIYSLMGMNNIEQIINSLFHIFDRCMMTNTMTIM